MYPKERFMNYLRELSNSENKKIIAALRQGIVPAKEHYSYRYLAPYCDLTNRRSLVIFKTIAAMYATHPLEMKTGNLGSAFRKLCSGKEDLERMSSKILRLIASDTAEEACLILSKYFSLFKAKKAPFPFESVLQDFLFWGKSSKMAISKEFWLEEEKSKEETSNE